MEIKEVLKPLGAAAIITGIVGAIGFGSYSHRGHIEGHLEGHLEGDRAEYNRQVNLGDIEGIVLEEQYVKRLEPVSEKHIRGLVSQSYSNETVKLESSYTLKVKADDGRIMGLSIIDGGRVKKEALDILIEEGSRVSFPAGIYAFEPSDPSKYMMLAPNIFSPYTLSEETIVEQSSQTATKRADRIRVLD